MKVEDLGIETVTFLSQITHLIPVGERLGRRRGEPHCVGGAEEGHVKPEGEAMHHGALQDVELEGDFCWCK